MNEYKVIVELGHESYGGYYHSDGREEFYVKARNTDSAKTKAKKLIAKKHSPYDHMIKAIHNTVNSVDFIIFS